MSLSEAAPTPDPTADAIGAKFMRTPSLQPPQTVAEAPAAFAAITQPVHLANFSSARSHALDSAPLPRERVTAESLAATRAASQSSSHRLSAAHAFAGRSLPFSFARPPSSTVHRPSFAGSALAPRSHHARRHTRRPSEMVGSSVLATEITLDSEGDAKLARALHAAAAAAAAAEAAHATAVPSVSSSSADAVAAAAEQAPPVVQRGVLRTPLDDVPALFSAEALHALSAEPPFLADIATLIESLTHLTTESDVDLYAAAGAKQEAPRPGAFATVLPNVSAGWTGRRKQAVSEMMLQLQNITSKLLVDAPPPPLHHTAQHHHSLGGIEGNVNPLSNLRREFLGSREILSLIQQCSALPASASLNEDGSPSQQQDLSALAPALLALAKDYQNRLLEFQVMDEVRFEVERAAPPPLPMSAAAKRAAAAAAAAAAGETKQLQPSRKMSAMQSGSSGTINPHVRKRSSSVSNAAALLQAKPSGAGHARRPSAAVSGRKPSISLPAGQPLMPALAAAGSSSSDLSALTAAPAAVASPPVAAPASSSSKWLRLERQGNLDMYLPWALVRRETHLFAPEIQELTKLFWRVGFVQEDGSVLRGDERMRMQQQPHKRLHSRQDSLTSATGAEAPLASDGGLLVGLPRKIYIHLFSLIHFVLKPSYLPSYAQQVVAADWLADLHMQSRPKDASRTLMSLAQFHLGLFNLVDVWTEGVGLDEYVSFLRNLFVFITEEIPEQERTEQSFDLEAGVSDLSDGMVDPATLSLALPPLGNVFRRRLRPLNITNINNLRRLGLRALMPQLPGGAPGDGPGFASLTLEIQKDVEEKARQAACQTASNLSRMAEGLSVAPGSEAFSRVSSTASLLAGFAQRGDEPEEYRPSHLSLSRNVELSSLIHAAPSAAAPLTPTGATVVSSAASHHRQPSLSAALAQPGQGGQSQHYRRVSTDVASASSSDASATGGSLVSPRSRRTHSRTLSSSGAPQPSWVTLVDLKAPAKATVTAVPAAALSIPSLGSSQAESESDEDDSPEGVGTIVEEDEDSAAVAAVLAEADAAVIVPAAPKLISGRSSKHPSKQKKSGGLGALSWRRASNDAASLENDRAMAESFRNMALEFEEIKARARRARLEGQAGTKRTGAIDEEDEEDESDDEGAAAAARRKKRASGKLKPKAGTSVTEEKEQDLGPKFNPFANGLPPSDDGDTVPATVKRKPRPPSAAAQAAAAFEAQRTAFQRESAEYLRRVTRLQFEAQATIRVPADSWHTRTPSKLPTEPHSPLSFEQTGVSATSVELKQLIQKQICNQLPLSARQAQPMFSGAQSAPVTPHQERDRPRSAAAAWSAASTAAAANSALTHDSSMMSPPPPFRMLLSPHAPSADQRDRPWRVMPSARLLDVHVARMEAAGRRPASAASAQKHVQHCDCYYCVEKFADRNVPATNTAHLRASGIHRLMQREAAAPNRGANTLQSFISQMAAQ